ncbi:hypothetical protein ES705_35038 [subsurface metagenome]
MTKQVIVWLLSLIMIVSCKNIGDSIEEDEFVVPDSIAALGPIEITEDAMEDVIQNIVSPVEIAALVNILVVPFPQKYLSSSVSASNISTNFNKAFKIGVYVADLVYLNIYKKTSSAIDYITAIKQLANGINVGQYIDFDTLKRLASTGHNIDSLMYLSVRSFNKMDKHLRETERSHLSALIITGLWFEGMYLATQIAKNNNYPEINERIGEQKIILNDLLLILNIYKKDKIFAKLIKNIETVKKEFDKVEITYEQGEPEMVEKDGMLVIIQNETSVVHMTEIQLENIINKIEEVHNMIIEI